MNTQLGMTVAMIFFFRYPRQFHLVQDALSILFWMSGASQSVSRVLKHPSKHSLPRFHFFFQILTVAASLQLAGCHSEPDNYAS